MASSADTRPEVRLRQEKIDLATFEDDGEAVEPSLADLDARRRSKEIAAENSQKPLARVRRRSWYRRRTTATAPTARDHERRVFAVTLLAGACGIVAVVLLASQVSTLGG